LWFEHDLYDQLQLLQALDWLAGRDLDATRVSLICIDAYPGVAPFYGLGQLTPGQLATLFPARQAVSPAQLARASAAWAAFTSPDPTPIETLLAGDTSALPFLRAALLRHLEQFPAVGSGLSRTERQILETLAAGDTAPRALFRASYDQEEAPFMGDAGFFARAATLGQGPHPLLANADGSPFAAPTTYPPDDAFVSQRLTLTDQGRAVLAGHADWIALRGGLDRWLGGVHLYGPDAA
ncbi:MAG TPA: hypothetical protein VGS80_16815, partial [Ktedonobacterales bacterium]|nr:hypothetical protein [Ktedonobacterales bacterium]